MVNLVVHYPESRRPSSREASDGASIASDDSEREFEIPEEEVDIFVASLPKGATVLVDEPLFAPGKLNENRTLEDWEIRLANHDKSELPPLSRPRNLDKVHQQGFTGKGVTVAVVDSGLHPHADFGDRLKAFKDFSSRRRKPYDPDGHGTHVASVAVGGSDTFPGVAPEADLVAARIGNDPKQAIKAIDWVIDKREELGIDVLNLSLGVTARLPVERDSFAQAAQRAVDAGLVVVVASGNECKSEHNCPFTISSPGTVPSVITVGALDDRGTEKRSDDGVWTQSSRGPTRIERLAKPDLVARGVGVFAAKAPGGTRVEGKPVWGDYLALSGSSQAVPMVSGAAALLLQANPDLTHDEIKEILTDTADPLRNYSVNSQGAGVLDLAEAIERAQSA